MRWVLGSSSARLATCATLVALHHAAHATHAAHIRHTAASAFFLRLISNHRFGGDDEGRYGSSGLQRRAGGSSKEQALVVGSK